MSIQLVTYANQTVTPTNDAIIYERAIDQNGIFNGCNVTVSGNEVHITGGYGMVCGREFTIQSESIAVTLAPSGTLDGRLYVRLDLADADAPIQLLTATGSTLPPLEQDSDVNYTNGTYEMELATFTVGVSALSDIVETFKVIHGTNTEYELIWENPNGIANQTSTMGEEEVEVSSLSYVGYLVEFRAVYNNGAKVYAHLMTGATGMFGSVYSVKLAGNPINIYRRNFYPVAPNKMHFTDCTRMADASAAVTGSDKGCLVPLRIWGIKL